MKKFIALLTALSLVLSLAACGGSDKPVEPETTTEEVSADNPTSAEVELTEAPDETVTNTEGEVIATNPDETTAPEETSALDADPAKWSEEEIIEFYKQAARKSKSVKSQKKMVMGEFVVNDGDGFLGTFVEMATPLFKSTLEDNSPEFDGITGGYEKLSPSDVRTAKAYKSGNYTVIEMTMVEQVDGARGSEKEGTVGHAISVVGNLSIVEEKLKIFFIDFDNADVKIRYANPVLKVKINNSTGKIEKGTWSYDVLVNIKNLYIKNLRLPIELTIKSGHGSVAFSVTVGGGF